MIITENQKLLKREGEKLIRSKRSKQNGKNCSIANQLDNATLDVSSHQERKYFEHTQIQGMLDFLLHENKKENVEEQFIEPCEDCVASEELSGVLGKCSQEAIVGATMRGTLESLLDESNQTHSLVSPEHTILAYIEEMPDLIFDVSKEYQTTMHAKVPSQQDH